MTALLHERLAEAAKSANQEPWHITIDRAWHKALVTHHGQMEDGDPSERTLATVNDMREDADATLAYLQLAQPANVAKLCEQVRGLLGAVQAVEDFISGKPGAPDPFGITRDSLRAVKEQ